MGLLNKSYKYSQGIRLPKAFLKNIQITENDPVDKTLENEKRHFA